MTDLDVLVFGGGIAGLWTLSALREAGWSAALVESRALGSGQTTQSQGIVHGGGKYMLLGQADSDAVRAIREMPATWLGAAEGRRLPDLRAAKILSRDCLLWVPRGGAIANLREKGLMAIVVGTGMLAAKPVELPKDKWPAVLRDSALAVWTMPEPVFDAGSVLAALAAPHSAWIRGYDAGTDAASVKFEGDIVRAGALAFRPRLVVLAAGEGNEALARRAGCADAIMQRRPLAMGLLRGAALPELRGHGVVAGKTQLTVTSVRHSSGDTVWQLGGEAAEKTASEPDDAKARAAHADEVRRWLPAVDLSKCQIAVARVDRAESRVPDHRRPSGVQARRIADRPPTFACWPTKLALAPALAADILAQVAATLGKPGPAPLPLPEGPVPKPAAPPWETVTWHEVKS